MFKQPATVIGDSWDSIELAAGQDQYHAPITMATRVTKSRAYSLMIDPRPGPVHPSRNTAESHSI